MCKRVFCFLISILLISCENDKISNTDNDDLSFELLGEALTPTTVLLTWQDDFENELGFYVYRMVMSDWIELATLPPNSESYTDSLLLENTIYFYYATMIDSTGRTFSSDTISIHTPVWYNWPGIPFNPSPPDSALLEEPYDIALEWECIDPDGDTLLFDIYHGVNFPLELIASNCGINFYFLGTLETGTTYYWRIIAKDNAGHETPGPVWTYSTKQELSHVFYPIDCEYPTAIWIAEQNENVFICYHIDFGIKIDIIDLTVYSNPTLVSELVFEGDIGPYGICVKDDYAYIPAFVVGVLIVDISDILNPVVVRSYNPAQPVASVFVEGNYLYLTTTMFEFHVVDISDPLNPTQSGMCNISYSYPFDVYANGNFAYLSEPTWGTEIVDISTPENPTVINSITSNNITSIVVIDTLLYTTGSPVLQIYDISNIYYPTVISSNP